MSRFMPGGFERKIQRFAALEHLPPGYELTRRLAIESRRTFFRLNFLSLLPLAGGALVFYGEDRLLEGLPVPTLFDMPMNDSNRLTLTVIAVILTLAMLSIHEICHGLA